VALGIAVTVEYSPFTLQNPPTDAPAEDATANVSVDADAGAERVVTVIAIIVALS
jgi:hypothetical protein